MLSVFFIIVKFCKPLIRPNTHPRAHPGQDVMKECMKVAVEFEVNKRAKVCNNWS